MAIIPSQTGPKTEYYFEKLKAVFSQLGITNFELVPIDTDKTITELQTLLDRVDMIFISGGDTHYLRDQIMRPEVATLIRAQAKAGKLIIGQSAGAIVLTPNTHTTELLEDEPQNKTGNFESLNLVDFEFLPHFSPDMPIDRIQAYAKTTSHKIIAASESCALGICGKKIKHYGSEQGIRTFN